MKDDVLSYVEPIYRFCIKRLSSRVDAEDLSQEILLCVLEGLNRQNITNLNGYVWRVAHNRYANKIDMRNRENTMLCGDEYIFDIVDYSLSIDEPDIDEYQAIFKALHTLSSMYRDILVDYYVNELDTYKIAHKYDISVETVKWRLHVSRNKVKARIKIMNKTYERIKMHVMCNGSFHPNKYLCNQTYKAIAIACYYNPVTIEEISIATGIPTLYLDESIVHMVCGDAIEEVGGKYQTDFIILRDSDNKRMQKALIPSVVKIADAAWAAIEENLNEIREIGFYGFDFSVSKLSYILIPTLLRIATDKVKSENPEIMPKSRPLRKDGGNGWFIVTEGIERLDDNFSGCNGYHYKSIINSSDRKEDGRFIQYWIGSLFDDSLCASLKDARFFVHNINAKTGEFISENDDEIVKAISLNLIEKKNDKYFSSIPIFTQMQYEQLWSWASRDYGISKLFKKWMLSLYNEFKSFTPKRLHEQIIGNVDSYSFNSVAFVIKELQTRGEINIPNPKKIFSENILFVKT